jgi:hypothetical protein
MQKFWKRKRRRRREVQATTGGGTTFEEVVVVSEVDLEVVMVEVLVVVFSMACSGEAPGLAIPVDRLATFMCIAPREVCRLLELVARWLSLAVFEFAPGSFLLLPRLRSRGQVID